MKLILTFAGVLLTIFVSYSQSFITPLRESDISMMKSAVVETVDGDEIGGSKFSSYVLTNGQLNAFTLKKDNGEKQKFKAAEVKLVKIEPNGFAKTMTKVTSSSLRAALKKDYSAIDRMKYVVFEQVEIKAGKYKLLQLLNPGMDEYIKVYLDPNAKTTSSIHGITGGEDKSYFIKKDDRSFLLKKGKYKKEFLTLFGDSALMIELANSKGFDMDFRNLPGHIAFYNENKLN